MEKLAVFLLILFSAGIMSAQSQYVGVGTTNPLEKFHVVGGQARADNVQMGNGRNNDGRVEFLNSGWGRIGAVNGLAFWADSLVDDNDNPAMYIGNNGRVGIGTTLLQKGLLEVNGYVDHNPGNFVYFARDAGNNPITGGIGSQVIDISLYCSNRVVAKEFNAHSDIRIKKVLGISNPADDLKTLLKVQVMDYTFIDQNVDSRKQKKVIAQQVAAVYPEAVSLTTAVVPDIFRKGTKKDDRIELASNGLKKGDRVRLLYPNHEDIVEVVAADEYGFTILNHPGRDANPDGEVFVYGREVNDFHTVDYAALGMLNVSATQAQQALIDNQADEIRRLKEKMQEMEARMKALESR